MELKTISRTIGLAAGILVLGAGITKSSAAEGTYCAGWVTGVSRDSGKQSLKLGDVPNDRRDPRFYTAYYSLPQLVNKKLADVKKISASFYTPRTTTNYVGSPRFSVELMNADNTPSGDVIFLDPVLCRKSGPCGWYDADFIGNKTGSIMDARGVKYTGNGTVSAWAKLVSDPYYAGKKVSLMYLIQDASTGPNYVDKITLNYTCLTKAP
jgi:hypothetical protein